MLAYFNQGVLTGDWDGPHISPIGAYDGSAREVLIMDVDREWYVPYWSPDEKLLEAMLQAGARRAWPARRRDRRAALDPAARRAVSGGRQAGSPARKRAITARAAAGGSRRPAATAASSSASSVAGRRVGGERLEQPRLDLGPQPAAALARRLRGEPSRPPRAPAMAQTACQTSSMPLPSSAEQVSTSGVQPGGPRRSSCSAA